MTSISVHGARLTMALQVQEPTLRAFFKQSSGLARGTGFLARFLIAVPESTQGTRLFMEPPVSWPQLDALQNRIRELLAHRPTMDADGSLTPTVLELTPEAKAEWINYHDHVEGMLGQGGELADVRDVASKSADNAARIAALFHVVEHGPQGRIDAAAMRQASRLAVWYLRESQRFLSQIAAPPALADAVILDAWLIDRCVQGGVSAIPFGEALRYGPGKLRRKAQMEATLTHLVASNRARMIEDGAVRRIVVNPALISGGTAV